ncbi:copper chaperone PCu(A)C [Sphingomonas sp. G-3-2-10]|uniref:copper chaperone PCu(A)C n=1 Tax=Sphingomonas sp. G-3-2-10 TaxID=2728838 RepID=UPI00146D1F3C|nr:copper chaperone PCu(A)C [Sphingomonas sp. G-3-2-10]NML05622.1 copper chaperone PCu(A)C [Sphingomonas sp. G-3-2-10]
MKAGYLAAATAALLAAVPIAAQDYRLGTLTVTHAWTRQTAPSQSVGGGFLTVANGGKAADRLVAASSPVSARVELHTMSMEGGVMRMRQVTGGLDVPAGGKLELKPGGYHLMLIGLKKPLVRGTAVPVTLQFQRAGKVTVQLKVESISYGGGK